jgi:hypothetical protein
LTSFALNANPIRQSHIEYKRRTAKKFFFFWGWLVYMWHKIDYPCKWTSQFTDASAKNKFIKKRRAKRNLAAKIIFISPSRSLSVRFYNGLHYSRGAAVKFLCHRMNIYGQIIYRKKFYCDLIQFYLLILLLLRKIHSNSLYLVDVW